MTIDTHTDSSLGLSPAPFIDLPSARAFVHALGHIYLEAGLPLALAFEAALADYRSFGLPCQCLS